MRSSAGEIRDGIEGTDQIGALERGIAEEGNLQAALDTLLAAAKDGDTDACEAGLQLSGDLFFYWHIRGKNIIAARVRRRVPRRGRRARSDARAAGRADHRGPGVVDAGRARAVEGGALRGVSHRSGARSRSRALRRRLPRGDRDDRARSRSRARDWRGDAVEWSRERGLVWAEGFASTIDGIVHTVAGDVETAHARYSRALEIQQQLGDDEGAGLSLGGLAQLAAIRGDLAGVARALPTFARRVRSDRRPRGGGAHPLRDGVDAPPARGPDARAPVLPRLGAGVHRRGERPRSRALADRARGRPRRSSNGPRAPCRSPPRRRSTRRRRASSTSTPTRRRGASSSTRRRAALSADDVARADRGRPQAHDQGSARPGRRHRA